MENTQLKISASNLISRCQVTGLEFSVSEPELELIRRLPQLNPALRNQTLPLPNLHPYEHLRRITAFGGLRHLYHGTSTISGKPQLTRYNPKLGYKICTIEEFFNEEVDNTLFGFDYDWNQNFFTQWTALTKHCIYLPLSQSRCEDSLYTNAAIELKNCYLCFSANRCQDCMYGLVLDSCTDCVDCAGCTRCELCFNSVDLINCSQVNESTACRNSRDLFGCYDCHSCSNCFGCVGLEHKSYCVFNEPVGKSRYIKFINSLDLNDRAGWDRAREQSWEFWKQNPHHANTVIGCENSSGANLVSCQNMLDCYNGAESSNCGYLLLSQRSHFCFRGMASNAEYGYSAVQFGARLGLYSNTLIGGEACIYSIFLHNCSHCFGCVALKDKKYCIFNKQFSKTDYLDLVPRIVRKMKSTGEWGQWFPPSAALHPYHECSAHEWMRPIDLDLARQRGYRIEAESSSGLQVVNTQAATPSAEIIICEVTGKPFKLQRLEQEFYQKLEIPRPRLHWHVRIEKLVARRSLAPAV